MLGGVSPGLWKCGEAVSVGQDQIERFGEGEPAGGGGGASGMNGAKHQRAEGQPLSCKPGRCGGSAAAEGQIQTGQFKNM